MNMPADTASRRTREILERIIMNGRKPDVWEMHELGLDVKYLEQIVKKMQMQLWRLPNFRPLKETAHSGWSDEYRRRFNEASYADVPCLRVTRKSYTRFSDQFDRPFYYPLLSLSPVGDSSPRASKDIELFLTGNGQWILYRGSDLSDESSFTICQSVTELSDYLDGLCGETHKLSPPRETVLVEIANWLVKELREDITRLKQQVGHSEATLAECTTLQERISFS